MRSAPFTRSTLVAAVLEQHSQARFNQMILRLGLEDEISSSTALSVANKCALLGRIVVQRAGAVRRGSFPRKEPRGARSNAANTSVRNPSNRNPRSCGPNPLTSISRATSACADASDKRP